MASPVVFTNAPVAMHLSKRRNPSALEKSALGHLCSTSTILPAGASRDSSLHPEKVPFFRNLDGTCSPQAASRQVSVHFWRLWPRALI